VNQSGNVALTASVPSVIAAHPGGPNPITVQLFNTAAAAAYLGPAGVSVTTGLNFPVSTALSLTLRNGETLYAVSAGAAVIYYLISGL
jgi:hypothetical protein